VLPAFTHGEETMREKEKPTPQDHVVIVFMARYILGDTPESAARTFAAGDLG